MDTYEDRLSAHGGLVHLTVDAASSLVDRMKCNEPGEGGQLAPLREKDGGWVLFADSINIHPAGWVYVLVRSWAGAKSVYSEVLLPAPAVVFIEGVATDEAPRDGGPSHD